MKMEHFLFLTPQVVKNTAGRKNGVMSGIEVPTDELRAVDRQLLEAIRRLDVSQGDAVGIGQLIDQLGVTATAVRQRIERLLEMGLIEREKIVHGRGRPTFHYHLTILGYRRLGANPTDIAEAMWREILAISDRQTRDQVLAGVAARMGRQYASQISAEQASASSASESFDQRMRQLSRLMTARHIPVAVSNCGSLPVLDIGACPYPSLTDASDDRAMCHLEEQMISEALGQRVHLSSCCLDGDTSCQFTAVDATNKSLT